MQDEDVVFRSFKGIAFISIAPLIALSASLWFTSDSVAYFLAHLGQIYFSIILFFLFGNIWSIRNFESSKYKKELTLISFIPPSTAILGAFLTVYINPAWGTAFLLSVVYLARHLTLIKSMVSIFPNNFQDLINKISIILCICLMLILTYWINPYTYPLAIYY
jgi:hypothetical protein